MPDYKTGERLRSTTSTAQFIVVRAEAGTAEITCEGVPFLREGEEATPAVDLSPAEGPKIEIGKRYEDEEGTIELLCISGGNGNLKLAEKPLQIKVPKPLPASD